LVVMTSWPKAAPGNAPNRAAQQISE